MVASADQLQQPSAPEAGENLQEMDEMTDRIVGGVRRRALLVFVGGTGLHALDTYAKDMERHGKKFGDEVEAIFIDTDISAIDKAVNGFRDSNAERTQEEIDREREQIMLSKAKNLGAHVCDISLSSRAQFVTRAGLSRSLAKMPAKESVVGAKACPTVGMVCYIAARVKDDADNPGVVAKRILEDWLSAKKGGGLGKETSIMVVSGSHGGTGPAVSKLVMADLQALFRDRLSGQNDTLLITERYLMTSESSGIDESVRKDGHQLRRDVNCGWAFIDANAAAIRRSVQIRPGEFIRDGHPTRTYFIGAGNPRCQVDCKDGHYGPADVIAKLLRMRTGDTRDDIGATVRANTDSETPEELNLEPSPNTKNVPLKMFCAAGIAEVLPAPDDKGIITRNLRRKVFMDAVGLAPNLEAVDAEVAQTLPGEYMKRLIDGFTLKPLMPDSLDKDTVKTQVSRNRSIFITSLQQNVPGYLQNKKEELVRSVGKSVEKLKLNCGLRPTLDFVEALDSRLEAVKVQANNELNGNCSESAKTAISIKLEEMIQEFLSIKQSIVAKIFTKAGLADGSKHEQSLDDAKNALAEAYNELIELMRNRVVLIMWQEQVYVPMKRFLSDIHANLRAEVAAAKQVYGDIKIDPKERPMLTPFDIGVEVHPSYDRYQDMPGMRRQYFTSGWTKEAMQALVKNVVSTDDDIDLLGEVGKKPAYMKDLDEYSAPLTRPVDVTVKKIGMARSYDVTVPVDTADKAVKYTPNGATAHPVGRGGKYEAVRTAYGISLLDDAHIRKCLKAILELPPTKDVALQHKNKVDSSIKPALNRDDIAQWQGEFRDKAFPVFEALAQREIMENGSKGEVASCPGTECNIPFYLSPEDIAAKITCCPSCRKIQGK